jgi:hypothetical protein
MTPDLDSLVPLPEPTVHGEDFQKYQMEDLRLAAFNAGRRYQAGEDAKVCDVDPVAIGIFHAVAIRLAAKRIGEEK